MTDKPDSIADDRAAKALWDEIRPMLGWPQNAVTWERMAPVGRRRWIDAADRLKKAMADD